MFDRFRLFAVCCCLAALVACGDSGNASDKNGPQSPTSIPPPYAAVQSPTPANELLNSGGGPDGELADNLGNFPEGVGSQRAALAAPAAQGCARKIHVTFLIYSEFRKAGVPQGGCWTFDAPIQSRPEWHICTAYFVDTVKRGLWVYDETSVSRMADNEKSRVTACAGGAEASERTGYLFMAPGSNPARWQYVDPGSVVFRAYAEVYTSNPGSIAQTNLITAWERDQKYASPTVNIGALPLTAQMDQRVANVVYNLCRQTHNGAIGLFAGQSPTAGEPRVTATRLQLIYRALNACVAL